jgi:hypothetical protein
MNNWVSREDPSLLDASRAPSPQKDFILPLAQILNGESKSDSAVLIRSTPFQWADDATQGTKNVVRIHDTAEIRRATKASHWEVEIVFNAFPSFFRSPEPR